MGTCLNPGNKGFQTIVNGNYVDKTGLIDYVNSTINTPLKLTSFSRPRRFGKSFAVQMRSISLNGRRDLPPTEGRGGRFHRKSETFESLKQYISMNFDGLRDAITLMLGSQRIRIDTGTFQNDITSFDNRDDVLTLLIHLGYLAYDQKNQEVSIPNREVAEVFRSAIKGGKWRPVEQAIEQSEKLLEATIRCDSETVATSLETIHEECSSVLTYNDENSLACTICIAYYTAKNCYTLIRELPSGKGYADYAFLPRRNRSEPAMIVELKYDQNADTAIRQIHDNRYEGALKEYIGNLLLVGINYDRDAKGPDAKKHSCIIERM